VLGSLRAASSLKTGDEVTGYKVGDAVILTPVDVTRRQRYHDAGISLRVDERIVDASLAKPRLCPMPHGLPPYVITRLGKMLGFGRLRLTRGGCGRARTLTGHRRRLPEGGVEFDSELRQALTWASTVIATASRPPKTAGPGCARLGADFTWLGPTVADLLAQAG